MQTEVEIGAATCANRELGSPLPNSPHAVSMSLPRWEHVVGYEEKKPEVTRHLTTGYPRFMVHPIVEQLTRKVARGTALSFPSARAAEAAAAYVQRISGAPARVVPGLGVFAVETAAAGTVALKSFWQHTGLIVSSRQAQACLEGRTACPEQNGALESLRTQLSRLYSCSPDDVFLAPTGMAAIYLALQALLTRTPGRPTAQLGFPYVDTLKLQEKIGQKGILLHRLTTLASRLTHLLGREPLAGCFCEIPGNPLLGSADLKEVSPLLRQHQVPLVTDDVVATPYNVDLTPYADLIATSLTKFIVGTGEAMGGALICNPKSPLHQELKAIVRSQHEELLWSEDAAVIARQAVGFSDRMRKHNEGGLFIAERLRSHPAVERVWYPKWEFSEAYEHLRRPEGGWGALITFLPRNAEITSPRIYDHMTCCKGPSLGTVFTLACPFTLLAHYTELGWAESCGVPRNLIRISVGLEDPEQLWAELERTLSHH